MLRMCITTVQGLEDVSAGEVESLGGRVVEVGRGRIIVDGDLDLIAKLNYMARTIERVLILLRHDKFETLEDLYRIVRDVDFSFIKPNQSFAIRSSRYGVHEFTSLDVGKVCGQAVIDSYMEAKGVRLKVNLDDPDVILRVDVINDEVYVGLDTTGDRALHRRGYRVYKHPAPLNPSIASALVILSGWRCDEILVDPMCGSGTILIESAMMCRNIPHKFREFQFERIWDVSVDVVENNVDLYLIGIEKFLKHLRGARLNSEVAGVLDTIEYVRGDATMLCLKDVDVIVTNPPYGLRVARKGLIENLYRGFLKSAEVADRIVVITAEYRLFREIALNLGYEVEERYVKYGGLDTKVFILR